MRWNSSHYPRTLADISCRRVSVSLSVRLSVTSRCSTETAKRRITQTMPHDSPGTLVLWCGKSRQNSNGVTPNGSSLSQDRLPVRQRIDYKLAVLTYKIHHTSTPVYLSRHIQPLIVTRRLRSSATPRVCKPTTRTNFADRAFRCSAPTVWNSLTADIVDSCSLTTFKRKLKTFLFRHAFSSS